MACIVANMLDSAETSAERERFNFTDQKFKQFGEEGGPKRISRGVAAACFARDT